jgi:hypothetical protein
VFQALIHFIASLPGWILGLVHWVWVRYFHADPVVFGAVMIAVLAGSSLVMVTMRNAGRPR